MLHVVLVCISQFFDCFKLSLAVLALNSNAYRFNCPQGNLLTGNCVSFYLTRRTYGFQWFISECSRVKQDDLATSNISMAASAKTGCSIQFTRDIFFRAKFKIVGSGIGW